MFKAFLQCLFTHEGKLTEQKHASKKQNVGIKNAFSVNLDSGYIPEPIQNF